MLFKAGFGIGRLGAGSGREAGAGALFGRGAGAQIGFGLTAWAGRPRIDIGVARPGEPVFLLRIAAGIAFPTCTVPWYTILYDTTLPSHGM